MRKLILSFLVISFTIFVNAQNVGIGTVSPSEKLDVNGNINIQGNLKVNGDAGQAGQVLRVNNDGTQSWANAFGYKNRKIFYTSGTFVVPDGVKEIMVETMGGGGGGAKGGGGGGGSLAVGVFKVSPGTSISYTVGTGGAGAVTEAGNGMGGSSSFIVYPGGLLAGNGGSGASDNVPGVGGLPGISGDSLIFVQLFEGLPGGRTIEVYSQRTSTEFATSRYYGRGGTNRSTPNLQTEGAFFSFNTVTLFNILINYIHQFNRIYGAGGGGGNTSPGNWGQDGGSGYVAFSW